MVWRLMGHGRRIDRLNQVVTAKDLWLCHAERRSQLKASLCRSSPKELAESNLASPTRVAVFLLACSHWWFGILSLSTLGTVSLEALRRPSGYHYHIVLNNCNRATLQLCDQCGAWWLRRAELCFESRFGCQTAQVWVDPKEQEWPYGTRIYNFFKGFWPVIFDCHWVGTISNYLPHKMDSKSKLQTISPTMGPTSFKHWSLFWGLDCGKIKWPVYKLS